MTLTDVTGEKIDIEVFRDNKNITATFFESFAVKQKDENTLQVTTVDGCIKRTFEYINKLGRYAGTESTSGDYVIVGGKRLGCGTE